MPIQLVYKDNITFLMYGSMERKILDMEWKWNGRKFEVQNTEKSSSISFH